jgi:hypothetical protein
MDPTVADGSADEIVRLAVEVDVDVELVAGGGVEKPEHALDKSSPNRIVIRAVHWKKIVRVGCLCSAESGTRQDIYQASRRGCQEDTPPECLLKDQSRG